MASRKRRRDESMTPFAWLVAVWAMLEAVALLYYWGAFNPRGPI